MAGDVAMVVCLLVTNDARLMAACGLGCVRLSVFWELGAGVASTLCSRASSVLAVRRPIIDGSGLTAERSQPRSQQSRVSPLC